MEDEKARHLPADLERAGALQSHVRRKDSGFNSQDCDAVYRRNAYQAGEKAQRGPGF
jgi:hypothetical protein